MSILARSRVPLTTRALLGRLGGHRHHSRQLKSILRALERERRIERDGSRVRLLRPDGLIEGRRTRGGAVVDAGGRTWDVSGTLVDADEAGPDAIRSDRVWIAPVGDPEQGRAELLGPVEPARDRWIGLFQRSGRGGVITPYRDDAEWALRVDPRDVGEARGGEVVAAAPIGQGTRRGGPPDRARVVERLGRPGDPEADACAIAWHHGLRTHFPEPVLAEAAEAIGPIDDAERELRADLRHLSFVTIDPESARDHDDAVCVETEGDSARLWVAVADVSHFVRPGSALDREALLRGNSVYWPDRAIPMLPERLSSDLCSLRPEEERRAMVVEVPVSADGRAGRPRFHWAVVRSRARLEYEEAAAAMEGPASALPAGIVDGLRSLHAVAERLGRRRRAGGSLDLQRPEIRVCVGADGRATGLVERTAGPAHRAIEEAMLAANRAVGEALREESRPAIYRVHAEPDASDLEDLGDRLAFLGVWRPPRGRSGRARLDHRRVGRWLSGVNDPVLAGIASDWTLRAMKQARYAARPAPHDALAFDTYLHFTSPIRRYADLVVHRALVDRIAGLPAEAVEGERERLARIAARLGRCERGAVRSERDAVALWTLEWLAQHVGEEHEGRIRSAGRAGLWVRLAAWPVDGFVPAHQVPGGVETDRLGLRVVDRRGRARMALGDAVRVRIEAVDRRRGSLELGWIDREPSGRRPRRSGAR